MKVLRVYFYEKNAKNEFVGYVELNDVEKH